MLPFSSSGALVSALLESHGYGPTTADRTSASKRPPWTITISREVGALGNALAKELNQRLTWPVYDHEILSRIADEMGRPLETLHQVDERHISWLEETLRNLQVEYQIGPDTYLKHLVATIRGLGAIGHCIIVGRGANCILPPETTLRVRLVADLPDRIKVISDRHHLPEKEAAAYIRKVDPERTRFIKNHFGKDAADPHLYDVVLNASRLSVADCADVVVDLLRRFETRAARVEEKPVLVG